MNPATGQLNPTGTTQALAYTYDAKNRLSRAQIGANTADFVSYKINAMGQRVQKTGAGLYAYNSSLTIDAATGLSPLARTVNFNARYVYDEQGRLIGEYAPDGKLISETVYFNDLPIATLRPKGANAGTPLGQAGTTTGNPSNGATAANANNVGNNSTTNRVNVEIFYVHADHLGTPRMVTRSTVATGANAPSSATANSPGAVNKAVWRWDSDPFGTSLDNSKPTENPQIITGTQTVQQAGTFKQNHRFPGQLADGESAKYYNYFRDYDSSVGRYSTSDPIGLRGGLNTFGYVANRPMSRTDPRGLAASPEEPGPPTFRIDSSCNSCTYYDRIRLDVQQWCDTVEQTITNPALARCLKRRCRSASIKCDWNCTPGRLGYNFGWKIFGLEFRDSDIYICPNHPMFPNALGPTAIHEWAHSCGWKHGDGGGVPGDGGYL